MKEKEVGYEREHANLNGDKVASTTIPKGRIADLKRFRGIATEGATITVHKDSQIPIVHKRIH